MTAAPHQKPAENTDPVAELLAVMARLRDPETGCPWDIEQDFESIVPHTIEEAYEVADAIERGDMDELKDELGDVLLQVVFHAQMAREQGLFDFNDVVTSLVEKLVYRHPHVFGDQDAKTAADVGVIWEAQKAKKQTEKSTLAGVTKGLPALLRAQKLQKKAAKLGFTWKTSSDAWMKAEEEYGEVRAALASGNKAEIADELGDLIFCLVNVARLEGCDAEEILRATNNKFIHNFSKMEEFIQSENKDLKDCTLAELLAAWKAAKA